MKRGVVLLALLVIMCAGMTGCILSTNPTAGTTIAVPMGESRTFTVKAFLNKTFTWYKDDQVIAGATAASYIFTPEAADADKLVTIKVVAIDLLNKTETKEWKAAVTNPPTADAGDDISIVFGATAELDGSGSSDPEGSPLTYQWTVASGPDGSTAEITGDTLLSPTFKPDIPGVYVISLVVNDGMVDSEADTVKINAYIDGTFESGIVDPWSVATTNASYALSSNHVHGGSKAFHPTCSVGHDNDNEAILTLTFPKSTYVYSISAWMYRVGTDGLTSAVHSELYVGDTLMLNGSPAPHDPHSVDSKYHILDPDANNAWVQRTWEVNAYASTITFKYFDLWLIDNIYLDDIEINTWGD